MRFENSDFFDTSLNRLNDLFQSAWEKNPINLIYALVRVGGMSDANWDPMEESLESLESLNDYENLEKEAFLQGNLKRAYRMQLLHYCHMIEASAPIELIANLIRCNTGIGFHTKPFLHLHRPTKDSLSTVPPSVKQKVKEIVKLEEKSSIKISDLLNQFVDEQIRNSFYHSDYCLTDSYYRSTGSGPSKQIRLEDLNKITNNAFSFYSALLGTWNGIREQLGRGKRVHQMSNYECLELLSDKDGILNGFAVHFSNGSVSTFRRAKSGITAQNIDFDKNGKLILVCGLTDNLKTQWVWNKQVVTNFSKLP